MTDEITTAPPGPNDMELDTVYEGIRRAEATAPSSVAQLTTAVNAFMTEQRQQASRMLGAPDHSLDGIRYDVRSTLEPLVTAFDEQLSAVAKATRVTITEAGAAEQTKAIATNRVAAVKAALDPAREQIQALISKTDAQIASVLPKATDEDRGEAADIAYRVAPLMPLAALNEIAREIGEAVAAKQFGRVVALQPYLDSMAGDPRYDAQFAEVQGLIAHVKAVSASWQVIVARARRERLDRLDWELQSFSEAIFHGKRGDAQQWLANQPGWTFTAPPPRVSDTPSRRSTGPGFKTLKISPEQRAAAKAARRQQVDGDE